MLASFDPSVAFFEMLGGMVATLFTTIMKSKQTNNGAMFRQLMDIIKQESLPEAERYAKDWVRTEKVAELNGQLVPMPRPRSNGWNRALTRTLRTIDGIQLRTLREAADFASNPDMVKRHIQERPRWQDAARLLLEAATAEASKPRQMRLRKHCRRMSGSTL